MRTDITFGKKTLDCHERTRSSKNERKRKKGSKMRFGKLAKSPVALVILLVMFMPFLWGIATITTLGANMAGFTSHLGVKRGYVNVKKVSNFVTLPFEMIDLWYGYGFSTVWVQEGTELFIDYQATSHGEPVRFVITDDAFARAFQHKDGASVSIETSGSGRLTHVAKQSGFYTFMVLPRRIISAGEDVNYTYRMAWGTHAASTR